jgi:hypothetical protein
LHRRASRRRIRSHRESRGVVGSSAAAAAAGEDPSGGAVAEGDRATIGAEPADASAECRVDAAGGEAGRRCGGAPDGTLGEAETESGPCAGAGADGADSKADPRPGVVSESAWGSGPVGGDRGSRCSIKSWPKCTRLLGFAS